MQLVQRPHEYDVLVTTNLFGDILSDLCSGLVGGLGVAPGANIGDDMAVFEPIHGSAPKYAGKNKVNPTATILSGALMLRHLGERQGGERGWRRRWPTVIAEGKAVTYDLKARRDDPTAVGTERDGRRHHRGPAPDPTGFPRTGPGLVVRPCFCVQRPRCDSAPACKLKRNANVPLLEI